MRFSAKKPVTLAVFTAAALIIHIVEAQIPLPLPVPGVRLGLANIVTLFMLFCTKPQFKIREVSMVLLCRIVLGALITGRPTALIFSLAGGALALAAQLTVKRFVTNKQIWVCGAMGGIFHNVGQISAAVFITGTGAIAVYLPVLIITGIITGVFTGLIAQLTVIRGFGYGFRDSSPPARK